MPQSEDKPWALPKPTAFLKSKIKNLYKIRILCGFTPVKVAVAKKCHLSQGRLLQSKSDDHSLPR
ncbi:hypothetical protein CLNEO_28680 [Anaerotignum neopropionicum]|uniref:Uncharacterized protein n=1 Tax=Anaerotignum neopropionicum TaxID=36847 RepID=A0A136WB20_9FIRM|nr:hypothetical protein CLNEO_28680 [Anaerotignum neopropionicum]